MASPPPPSRPTIAVVHDWLDTWAGGEQCLREILALYPDATLFSLVDFLPPPLRERIGGRRAVTSFVQRLPGAAKHFRRYLPLFPSAIERLDVSRFDIVISSSHAVAKGVRTHQRQLHVCYCYTPIRYAWDLREQYLGQVGLDRGFRGAVVRRALDRIRDWDRRTSARVRTFVAISQHVARRIERCYGRNSVVIHPPVVMPPPVASATPRRYYLTVSRLVPYKRIDAIAAAFRHLPDRELVVVGDGPERARIVAAAAPNVHLVGELDDAQRDAMLAGARAFVFAAEEDFGIAPVEALAHGTPVIAFGRGGVCESVRDLSHAQPTGVFFDAQTPQAIAQAVREFEANAGRFDPAVCRAAAEQFSDARFREEFGALIAAEWAAFAGSAGR